MPRQRCIFHKIQNLADHLVDRDNRQALLVSASRIREGVQTIPRAQRRLQRWADDWLRREPEAVANLAADFDKTLRCLNVTPDLRSRVRTNNPVERFMLELEKAASHVAVWEHTQSWERHVWIIWRKLTRMRYAPTRHPIQKQITRRS